MIELRNLCKSLNGREVLRGISLSVAKGETLAIVGASGAGKSVTLQHLVGLMHPDSGEVLIDGESVSAARGRDVERLRHRFGYLFQSGALINWMTVFDNVALPLRERTRMSEEAIEARVTEKLALVGLAEAADKMPAELSGGMKKRAGLARAIVHEPDIVLYDEPTSGLDPVLSRSIDALIRDLRDRLGVTSILVTHDLISAFSVADRIAFLGDGRIIASGDPTTLRASPNEIVQRFIHAQFGEQLEVLKGLPV